jgi:N-acetyl-1-D-myo-inositol-2-amino-2-deoxy-alpha-D-glucopyranoside deacetylase
VRVFLRHPTVLAVFAHPDDESFCCGGTLATLAARGVRVTVACATRGEGGKNASGSGETDIAGLREHEMHAACKALGLETPVFLDFHDSGFQTPRYGDPEALINADPLEVESRVLDAIAWFRPHVMIAFDPHGGYGHPDHIVMHRAATAAFFASAHLTPAPERLFYTAMPPMLLSRFEAAGFGKLDFETHATPEHAIAVKYNVYDQIGRKYAALRAHASQSGPGSGIAKLLPELERDEPCHVARQEWFTLGGARGAIPQWPLEDLFDGIE